MAESDGRARASRRHKAGKMPRKVGSKMRFSTRELVMLAIFGALWGGVEISLGSLFHALNIPITGMLLSALGLLAALVGRYYVPRVGSTLSIGVIAALLKAFSLGGIVIWPMIAIIMEALVADIALSLMGRPNRIGFVLSGGLGVLYSVFHPFFTQGLLAGKGVLFVWGLLVERGGKLLGITERTAWSVAWAYGLLHLMVGGLAGWLAWDIARAIRGRLLREGTEI